MKTRSSQAQPTRTGRLGLGLLALGLIALLFLLPSAAFATDATVVGNPVLNSGTGSTFTHNVNLASTDYVTRLNSVTYNFSGSNVATVTLNYTKTADPSNCTVSVTVVLKNSAGGTLASATSSLTGSGGTFSVTVNPSDVYYHRIATTSITFTQSGGNCGAPPPG